MNFVSIDFETATAKRNTPCALGITVVENDEITASYEWLIKPICYPDFSKQNIRIHGITPQDVALSPEFPEIWATVKDIIDNQIIVAHNASFDIGVLSQVMAAYELPLFTATVICTYQLAKKECPDLGYYSLPNLCLHFGIELIHHNALSDSIAAAKLLLSLRAIAKDINTFEPIIGQQKPIKHIVVGDFAKQRPDSIFYGKKVVFTGTLSSMTRKEAQQIIADIGGINLEGLTSATDFLIVGQQDAYKVGQGGQSTKQKKVVEWARKGIEIEIMTEYDFLKNI